VADKITNFEDYIKRSDSVNTEKEPRDSAGAPAGTGTVKNGDTGFIESIEIVDPYNFFTEEEREEYFRERQKAEQQAEQEVSIPEAEEAKAPGSGKTAADKPVDMPRDKGTIAEREPEDENTGLIRKHHIPREQRGWDARDDYEPAPRKEEAVSDKAAGRDAHSDKAAGAAPVQEQPQKPYKGDYNEEYDEPYDEESDEEYDEEYDDVDEDYDEDGEPYEEEDEESEGKDLMLVVVRFASILTGIVILAAIAFGAYKFLAPKFRPDPDEEPAEEVQVALPEGYEETGDMVTVTAASLNLRTVPSSDSDSTIVTSVTKGTTIKRIAQSSETTWAIVEYEGQQLYASSKYLEAVSQ
jgi:uncharacterized protein YgiM (DUF1202 family)